MTNESILERLLDRSDETLKELASLCAVTKGINDRLDKLNGSVAKHEEQLKALKEGSQVSNQTTLKIAAMVTGAVLAITHAEGPVLNAVLAILK